jgi:hypothetical protein
LVKLPRHVAEKQTNATPADADQDEAKERLRELRKEKLDRKWVRVSIDTAHVMMYVIVLAPALR